MRGARIEQRTLNPQLSLIPFLSCTSSGRPGRYLGDRPECSSHSLRILVVWHHVAVVGEPFRGKWRRFRSARRLCVSEASAFPPVNGVRDIRAGDVGPRRAARRL